ncbi:MAG: hypothetical protein ABIB71_04035, partial [Candidatus Woesearchaeota archaeon]
QTQDTIDTYSEFTVALYTGPWQPFILRPSHNCNGMMSIHRRTGDCLHTFDSGRAHIDIGSFHFPKLHISKSPFDRYGNSIDTRIKGLKGYF